jgi:hypothetical protein
MKRVGFETEKREKEPLERKWTCERIGDNGRENVEGTEAEEWADKGITKRRVGVRSGLAMRHAWRLSGSGMEMTEGRAAEREGIRASGERVWRDNRPPLEEEVM